jgi:hypothetical protein
MAAKSGIAKRREEVRQLYWPDEDLWTGEKEMGWFSVPRSLPLIMTLLSSKELSGGKDLSSVYLDLLSRQKGEGVIEMAHEADHAFAAGYVGNRASRTWQERMAILEEIGFIRTVKIGNLRYRFVAIIHPTTAIHRLRMQKRIPDSWWNVYLANKRESKEASFEEREIEKAATSERAIA